MSPSSRVKELHVKQLIDYHHSLDGLGNPGGISAIWIGEGVRRGQVVCCWWQSP